MYELKDISEISSDNSRIGSGYNNDLDRRLFNAVASSRTMSMLVGALYKFYLHITHSNDTTHKMIKWLPIALSKLEIDEAYQIKDLDGEIPDRVSYILKKETKEISRIAVPHSKHNIYVILDFERSDLFLSISETAEHYNMPKNSDTLSYSKYYNNTLAKISSLYPVVLEDGILYTEDHGTISMSQKDSLSFESYNFTGNTGFMPLVKNSIACYIYNDRIIHLVSDPKDGMYRIIYFIDSKESKKEVVKDIKGWWK